MNSQTIFSKAIIGKALTFSLALCLTGSAVFSTNSAYAADLQVSLNAAQDSASTYSADDLDNLLAPIALYPDPLLAQVLVAATFNDQIQDASQVLSAGAVAIDDQQWDDSVKAVAHYPKVLFTLAAQPDSTAAIGEAYAAQSTDVMNSIQRLRAMALAQGNLVSTQQQVISTTAGVIQILPARAGYFFLPVYNPELVFSTPAFISFGPALAIDASGDDQIDWHEHHIFDRHHHNVRMGDHHDRARFRPVRRPGRERFNPGRDRNRVTRSRFNPSRPTKPVKPTRPVKPTKPTTPTKTKTKTTTPAKPATPTKTATSAKPTTPSKTGTSKAGSTKSAATRGTVNRGQSNASVNRGQVNRGQANRGQVNRAQVNRSQANAAANRGQANRGQMNRASVNTAANRGGSGHSSGRNRR